jgi:hypothetical protein
LLPAGREGPAFLVTRNFDVVYTYNAAESYTLAACVLSDRLGGGRGIVTPGRLTICFFRAPGGRNCRFCCRGAAMTSAATRTGTLERKARAAIADFQQRAGLEVNGRPSVKVLAALKKWARLA